MTTTNPLYWTAADGTLHETYSAFIVVADQAFGGFSYDSGRTDLCWHRCSYAFFCPHCGEVWGRIVAANSAGEQQRFRVREVACAQHADYWNIPGSLLTDHLENLLKDLPPEAIVREFEVHLTNAEKELDNEQATSN